MTTERGPLDNWTPSTLRERVHLVGAVAASIPVRVAFAIGSYLQEDLPRRSPAQLAEGAASLPPVAEIDPTV